MNYVTTEQAKEMLGLSSQTTVRKYIELGYLKAKKLGNVWLVSKKSVLERKQRLTDTAQ